MGESVPASDVVYAADCLCCSLLAAPVDCTVFAGDVECSELLHAASHLCIGTTQDCKVCLLKRTHALP